MLLDVCQFIGEQATAFAQAVLGALSRNEEIVPNSNFTTKIDVQTPVFNMFN